MPGCCVIVPLRCLPVDLQFPVLPRSIARLTFVVACALYGRLYAAFVTDALCPYSTPPFPGAYIAVVTCQDVRS